jgi:uracil phosphoribosyltransferase
MPNLHVSKHPLVAHKLAKLRDKETKLKKFRELIIAQGGDVSYIDNPSKFTKA